MPDFDDEFCAIDAHQICHGFQCDGIIAIGATSLHRYIDKYSHQSAIFLDAAKAASLFQASKYWKHTDQNFA